MEGGLRRPQREPLGLDDPAFWDEAALDAEMRRQFDVCHGCRRCFNLCDSFPRLFDLIDAAETMELDSVSSSGFRDVVGACTLCDMCFMVSCPYVPPHEFRIDFPRLMLRARAIDFRKGNLPWRDRQLAEIDRNGRLAAFGAGILNALLRQRPVRLLLEWFAGIHRLADLPRYVWRPLARRWRARPPVAEAGRRRKAVVYATCFVNYNTPAVGEAALSVLERNGVDTVLKYPRCCGMPQYEQGDVERVRNTAIRTAREFAPLIDEGRTVVALTPSCALMLKSEWPALAPADTDVGRLAANTRDIDEYVMEIAEAGDLAPGLRPLEGGVTVHLACHSRAQNVGPKAAQMLRLIPETEVTVVERCSGHGGIWGMKKRWFDTAVKYGRNAANAAIRADQPHLAAACPLAGLHLSQSMRLKGATAPPARHPIELVAASYQRGTEQ